MAKPPITKTELIWPGKYTEEGVLAETPRASLPLQTVELYGPPTEWRNKLIWGDNKLILSSLKNGPLRERYSDPEAFSGHRSAISTRKGGGFYSYKIHAGSAPRLSFLSPGR